MRAVAPAPTHTLYLSLPEPLLRTPVLLLKCSSFLLRCLRLAVATAGSSVTVTTAFATGLVRLVQHRVALHGAEEVGTVKQIVERELSPPLQPESRCTELGHTEVARGGNGGDIYREAACKRKGVQVCCM
jgi:hypothetical protein